MRIQKFLNTYYHYLIIIFSALLVYFQNLWFDFAYLDDNLIIFTEYDKIDSLLKIPKAFLQGYLFDNYYRPMIIVSFIIDTAIAGQSSTMYHLTNVILHIVNSILIFNLLIKFKVPKHISLLMSVIFSIHPLNINSVSWIAGRNDLLLAFFSLLSFLSYLKFKNSKQSKFLLLSIILYFFSMTSKESGIFLLPLIFIYDYIFSDNGAIERKNIKYYVLYLIPVAIYFFFREYIVHINVRDEIGLKSFFMNIYILFEYLAKFVYFFRLEPLSMQNIELILIGIVITILLTFFIWSKRNSEYFRQILFGLVFLLIFIIPTLFVRVPADDGEFNYIDCRFYLPMMGLILISSVILLIINNKLNNNIKIFLIFIFLCYAVVFNFLNNRYYKDGLTFWSKVTSDYPHRATYWIGLGYYFYDNKNYIEAIKCVERAITIKDDISEYYKKAALAYEKLGEYDKSIELLNKSLNLETDKSATLLILIKNYLKLGNYNKAKELTIVLDSTKIKNSSERAKIYSSLSYHFNNSNFTNNAIDFMKKAVAHDPQNAVYFNDLGALFFKEGEKDSAKFYFQKALELDPLNEDYKRNFFLTVQSSK